MHDGLCENGESVWIFGTGRPMYTNHMKILTNFLVLHLICNSCCADQLSKLPAELVSEFRFHHGYSHGGNNDGRRKPLHRNHRIQTNG